MFQRTTNPSILCRNINNSSARLSSISRSSARSTSFRRTYASTTSSSAAGSFNQTHLYSGAAGGVSVLLGAYIWYNVSGTKKVVQAAKTVVDAAQKAKDTVAENAPVAAKQAVSTLRTLVKSVGANAFPGAGPIIDQTLDQLDELNEKHGDRVEALLKDTFNDLKALLQDSKSGIDASTGYKVLHILQSKVDEASALVGDVSSDVLDQYPDLRDGLKAQFEELKKLVEEHGGDDAKKVLDDTYEQVKKIAKGGVNPAAIASTAVLVNSKIWELKGIAKDVGSAAFDKASEKAAPALKKLPDIKKYLEQNKDILSKVVGEDGEKLIEEIYDEIKKVAEKGGDKKSLAELKKFVEGKVGDLKNAGGKTALQGWDSLKNVPGLKEFASATPSIGKLQELAKEHGSELQDIVQDTYKQIEEIVGKQLKKAEKVVAGAKDDVKKETKKGKK